MHLALAHFDPAEGAIAREEIARWPRPSSSAAEERLRARYSIQRDMEITAGGQFRFQPPFRRSSWRIFILLMRISSRIVEAKRAPKWIR